jgi:glycine/D-amino acid oxidase-like deaminating enzyme
VEERGPGSGASFGNAGIVVNTNLRPVFAGLNPAKLLSLLRDPSSPLNVVWSRFLGLAPWFMRMLRHAKTSEVERITRALATLCHPGAALYDDLLQQAGRPDLVEARGSLALCRSAEERDAHWEHGLSLLRKMNVPMEKLDRVDIDALAPAAGPLYTHAVYSPAYRHSLDPERLVSSLFELFVARGGRAIAARAEELVLAREGANAVRTSGEAIRCENIVVAAGTASAGFAKQAGEPVPHQAVGGYHVHLRSPGLALETPLLPLDFRFAITPMSAGIRLAGIYEFGGEAAPFREARITSMLAHVGTVLPGVRSDERTVWRGFRSYLPDGLPIIGRSGRHRGLFYLFGFSSSGMINAPAAAKALSELMHGGRSDIDLEPFSIGRFGASL